MDEASRAVLLFGGGRWGRTLLPVIARSLQPQRPIVWVSRQDLAEREDFLASRGLTGQVEAVTDATAALRRSAFAAIVATAPRDHAPVARAALEAGAHVLVEKPLTLDSVEAEGLVALARARERLLAVDLEFRTAPFMQAFATRLGGRATPARIEVRWGDPEVERRHGWLKRPDYATPVCWDVYPHVWSLWQVLMPDVRPVLVDARRAEGGSVELAFAAEDTELRAVLDRRAAARIRDVAVSYPDGGAAELDFAEEPGTVRLDDEEPTRQPDDLPGPLGVAIAGFLRCATVGRSDFALAAERCLDSIAGAAAAAEALRRNDLAQLRASIGLSDPGAVALRRRILLDNVVPEIDRRDPSAARSAPQAPGWLDALDDEIAARPPDAEEAGALFGRLAESALRHLRSPNRQ